MRLGFLGPSLFRSENPDSGGWIVLDFLGFSRPNLDLSMGYTEKSSKEIFATFVPLEHPSGGRKAAGEACASAEVLIEQA
jgi:hypothetical protein